MRKRPTVIALSGGLCSGKSAVARWLKAQGYPVLDLDQVAREVVAPGQPALRAIEKAFGPSALNPDGTLNRTHLREIVFQDDQARARLEAITHPAIDAATRTWLSQQTSGPVFVEIPLLAEKGKPDYVDTVWIVDCEDAVRCQRCLQRGVDAPTFARICAAQASREQRLALADAVIDNSGEWFETEAQLKQLLDTLDQV